MLYREQLIYLDSNYSKDLKELISNSSKKTIVMKGKGWVNTGCWKSYQSLGGKTIEDVGGGNIKECILCLHIYIFLLIRLFYSLHIFLFYEGLAPLGKMSKDWNSQFIVLSSSVWSSILYLYRHFILTFKFFFFKKSAIFFFLIIVFLYLTNLFIFFQIKT